MLLSPLYCCREEIGWWIPSFLFIPTCSFTVCLGILDISQYMANVASLPGLRKREKRTWYPLFLHVRNHWHMPFTYPCAWQCDTPPSVRLGEGLHTTSTGTLSTLANLQSITNGDDLWHTEFTNLVGEPRAIKVNSLTPENLHRPYSEGMCFWHHGCTDMTW